MKRLAIYVCCTLLISLVTSIVGLFLLLYTPAGARFALTALPGIAGFTVSVRDVDGPLLGRLHLKGVRVTRAKLQVQIDGLDLAWDPQELLSGKLLVRELNLSGVRIQNDAEPGTKPPQLSWPHISGVLGRISARISQLQLKGLSYRSHDAPATVVTELATSLAFNNGLLSLSRLRLVTPDGRISGDITAGFSDALLKFDLSVAPTVPVQGMDRFSLQALLVSDQNPKQLSGWIAADGLSEGAKRLKITTDLGMSGNIFSLHRLNATRSGRRGVLSGEGSVTLTATEPLILLDLDAVDLDLERELKLPTRLSGTVYFSGSLSRFRGAFALANSGPGWQKAALAADYQGGRSGVVLTSINGALLEGSLSGDLTIAWLQGVQISGALAGRGLNPAAVAANWPGEINLNLAGKLAVPHQGALHGTVRGELLESRLHNQNLQGELLAAFAGRSLRIDQLVLRGKGFNLKGAGELHRRLDFAAQVSDLSRIMPDAAGELKAAGWLRWHNGFLSGDANWKGSNLAMAGMGAQTVQLHATIGEGQESPVYLDASLDQLQLGPVLIEEAVLSLQGTSARHTLNAVFSSPGSDAQVTLSGGYGKGIWRGELVKLAGRDSVGPWNLAAPVPLLLSGDRLLLDPLVINGLPDERIEIAGKLSGRPLLGSFIGAWNGVNLARANIWLDGVELTGGSSGNLKLQTLPGEQLFLSGRADAHGTVAADGQSVSLEQVSATLDGDGRGLKATLDLALGGGSGEAHLIFRSPDPAALRLPGQGDLTLRWSDLDLALLRQFVPSNVSVDGRLAGLVTGKLRPGKRLEMTGEASLSQSRVKLQGDSGEVKTNLTPVSLTFVWRGETLSGALSLALAEYGEARGNFILPIPARFPVVTDRKGALQGALFGKIQERGFLTALLPEQIQESHGDLDLNLTLGGIWNSPKLGGNLQISKGGAYLPSAGIRVSDVQLSALLSGDQIRIDKFRAVSGAGHIEGTGLVQLKGLQVAGYSGILNGERFQTIHLPELQLSSSPRLTFEGDLDKISLSGELLIPEMLVFGSQGRPIVTTSRDVIMEGAPVLSAGKKVPLLVGGQIHLLLGEKVQVKASGIDATLGGEMDLVLKGINKISSSGEIHVVKGRYRTYGVNLDIVRGRLYYVNGPVDQPNLDILALRTIGDVRAGVTVAGNLSTQVVKLYSEPPMPDVDIMSYVVLGHPLGSSSEQGNMVAMAANSLFTYGDSESLQETIKGRLGLSSLGMETVNTSGSGLMGYKEMSGAPAGVAPTKSAGGQSTLTVGKYLAPKLYLSYGRSLVTGGNLFQLRYDVLKHWQIETQSGSESGADLYYKLEFK